VRIIYLISFFFQQTHTTPVLLSYKDRAELAGSDKSISSVVEGFVITEKVEIEADDAAAN
jgi:hypothetical protein